MKIVRFILVIFVLSLSIVASAQVTGQDEMMHRRATEKVAYLKDCISFMANKKKPVESRLYYKTKALNLFIGKGFSYEENGVTKEGVMIHIKSNSRNGRTRSFLLRNYFQSLINDLASYQDLIIENVDFHHVVSEEKEDGVEYSILLGDVYAIDTKR